MKRKIFSPAPGIFPMPVLIAATYNENGTINTMTAAWGQLCHRHKIALFLDETHKTAQNIKATQAFTVGIADMQHLKEADYFGTVSGNDVADKFIKSKMAAVKSTYVYAPVLTELPVVMECKLEEIIHNDYMYCVIGDIVNMSASENVLDEKGAIDPLKLNVLLYDEFHAEYYSHNVKVGKAFEAGSDYLKE